MRAWIESDILYLHPDDVPSFQKRGSVVRNSYFWALRAIAARAHLGKPWEFEAAVWFALQRLLTSFMDSGYLATRETQLEFRENDTIPVVLQTMATWMAAELFEAECASDAPPQGDPSQTSFQGGDRPSPPYSRYINSRPKP